MAAEASSARTAPKGTSRSEGSERVVSRRKPGRARALAGLVEQSRLADAGRALDDHEAPVAVRHGRHRVADRAQLELALEQPLAPLRPPPAQVSSARRARSTTNRCNGVLFAIPRCPTFGQWSNVPERTYDLWRFAAGRGTVDLSSRAAADCAESEASGVSGRTMPSSVARNFDRSLTPPRASGQVERWSRGRTPSDAATAR